MSFSPAPGSASTSSRPSARAGATTVAADLNELAPALYAADVRASVPPVDDPGYAAALVALVAEHGVELIVPLADLDHRVLAAHRDALGALVLLAGPETISLCEDKYRASRFFESHGIASPPTWLPAELPDELPFPVLVKARRGFGSRHIYRAEDREELDFFLRRTTEESMIQQVCTGEEFSIDVFSDLDGRCLGAVPRTMIESKGGESIKGMTIKDADLIEHGRLVAETMGIAGPANVQCFREPDGSLPVTDVNPRFGGGFPAADGRRLGLPGAGARPRARRAPGAAFRRVPGGRDHDQVLLAGDPRALGRSARAGPRPQRLTAPLPCLCMRYLVTGAAGFIGSHLAEALAAQGNEVTGIDCFTDYYDPALKEENARGLDVQTLDLAEDELDFAGYDAVFHLAGQPGVRSFGDVFPTYLRRNVLASQRVFEAAARDGVRVVFASSSSVYGAAERYPTREDTRPQPLSPYGITKLACEQLAAAYEREFGLDCVVLRYFNAFGPRQRPDMAFTRIVNALASGSQFELYGDGDQSRGWTYVSDIVDATVAAATAGSGTYNVGGAVEASLNETIGLLEQISGRTVDVVRRPVVAGDQRRTSADTTRIKAELGWAPSVLLEDGLRAQWEWAATRLPLA